MSQNQKDWKIFQGDNRDPHHQIEELPNAPNWRPFGKDVNPNVIRDNRGKTFQSGPGEIEMVNAALYLRRPLLITGKPGTGKSSLAYAVARELNLGEVLYWPITTRTTLKDGLYHYDAIGRLQEVKQAEVKGNSERVTDDPQTIANYITLGPLGTALLPSDRPRILVIDEIDKSDIDLPNDLLTIFEEGRFEIPELARLETEEESQSTPTVKVRTSYSEDRDLTIDRGGNESERIEIQQKKASIQGGRIVCQEFPLVILTSNGERDFPPPFLRRCLRLNMRDPDRDQLKRIVTAHLADCDVSSDDINDLISRFLNSRDKGKEQLATDQLLNALFMVTRNRDWMKDEKDLLLDHLLAALDRPLAVKPKDRRSETPEK